MAHTCHATNCKTNVPPVMFMCRKHWFMLPKNMRDKVWANYKPGQCDDWHITHKYATAAREAVKFIAEKEGYSPNTNIYDMLDPERYKEE